MGIFDILNAGKIKKENEELKSLATPEMQDAANLKLYINDLEVQKEKLEEQNEKLLKSVDELKQKTIFLKMQLLFRNLGYILQDITSLQLKNINKI